MKIASYSVLLRERKLSIELFVERISTELGSKHSKINFVQINNVQRRKITNLCGQGRLQSQIHLKLPTWHSLGILVHCNVVCEYGGRLYRVGNGFIVEWSPGVAFVHTKPNVLTFDPRQSFMHCHGVFGGQQSTSRRNSWLLYVNYSIYKKSSDHFVRK